MPPPKKAAAAKAAPDPEAETLAALPSRLRKLVVKNFGCIGKTAVEVDLDDVVVLVGPNNVGKSTILHAYNKITSEASPKLTLDDFPNRRVDGEALPEVQLYTAVGDNPPASKWIDASSGENIVKERWVWSAVDAAAQRQGWDVEKKEWSPQRPWGAANVANARRPEPHRIEAFASPETQAKQVIDLLLKALKDQLKKAPAEKTTAEGTTEKTTYGKLLSTLADIQKEVVETSRQQIESAEKKLTEFIGGVFQGYTVKFDARPEESLADSLNFFKAGAQLQMGPDGGFLSSAEKQGSGARRTLMWAALRFIAENEKAEEGDRSNLLLLDEPELCLHPNAIRDACAVLYDLPSTGRWQVMVTTHSPAFIDLSRDNTTVVRVGRDTGGGIVGTTVFRPQKIKLDADQKRELKLLNIFDPHVAEFFFGGRSIIVEGDTEYTVFRYIANEFPEFKNLHVIRARGKATIALLSRILNQFSARYAVLHDSDSPTTKGKDGKVMANPAWTNNDLIRQEISKAPDASRVRLAALVPGFEKALFGFESRTEKPYRALEFIKTDAPARAKVKDLLAALTDFSKPFPSGCYEWPSLEKLKELFEAQAKT